MKIAFYETSDWESEYIKTKILNHELYFFPSAITKDQALEADYDIISPFVGSFLSENLFNSTSSLKFVATRSTGFDHIDLKSAKAKNISVSNVPTYGQHTVAEFTFALLLALQKKIYTSVKRVREQGLFSFDGLRGYDLKDKTIGIVGTGHIGRYSIQIAKGFGMKVVAFDPYPDEKYAKDNGFEYLTLDQLLSVSDVITLHVPYLPATHHMLNSETFKKVKPGAVLINTSRGALVETESLVQALRSGILSGAGLDVLEEEGYIKDELSFIAHGHPSQDQLKILLADHELMYMDNVIVTPHNAFNTKEALLRILDTTIENINSYIQGDPKNLVS